MKKTLLSFSIACAILVLSTSQVEAPKQEKEFLVKLTLKQWNDVIATINESSAPHNLVVGVQQMIVVQLQKQLTPDSTKKK